MGPNLTVLEPRTAAPPRVPRRRVAEHTLPVIAFVLFLASTLPHGSGWLRSGLAVALLVFAPTAPTLAQRIVRNLSMAMPLLVLTIWLPVGDAAIPTLLSGSGAFVVACGVRSGLRHLVPSSTTSERLTLLVAAGVAALVSSPFILGDAEGTLALLMRGWDHASHFDMYLAHRTGSPLGLPGPDAWYFQHYPQFFHALLAQSGNLVWGPAGAVPIELLRYRMLQPVVFVAVVVLVTAALLDAIPRSDRRRRLLAVLFTCVLLLAYPGSSLLLSGHLNFLVSASAASVLLILANRADRPFTAAHVVAMGSLVVVVSAWPLLLPCVALPALRAVITGLRTPQTRYWAAPVAVGAVVASCYLVAVSAGSDPVAHLVTAGGLVHPSLPTTSVVMAVLLVAACYPRARRRAPDLLLATVSSMVLLVGIASVQLVQTSGLGYYFWKASLGVELVLLVAAAPYAAMPCGGLARTLRPRLEAQPTKALTLSAFALLCTTALSQVPTGGLALYAVLGTPEPSSARDVGRQLLAVADNDSLDAATTTFVTTAGGHFRPALVNQWYHSLTRTRTVEAARFDAVLDRSWTDEAVELPQLVAEVARASSGTVAIGEPDLYRQAAAHIPGAALDRLVVLSPR